jgi:hypothetical protein
MSEPYCNGANGMGDLVLNGRMYSMLVPYNLWNKISLLTELIPCGRTSSADQTILFWRNPPYPYCIRKMKEMAKMAKHTYSAIDITNTSTILTSSLIGY